MRIAEHRKAEQIMGLEMILNEYSKLLILKVIILDLCDKFVRVSLIK